MIDPTVVIPKSKFDKIIEDARVLRPGFCRQNRHDLSLDGSRTKHGACRLCWNEYLRNRRAAKKEAAGGNPTTAASTHHNLKEIKITTSSSTGGPNHASY